MSDIATLGLVVDSSQVKTATTALQAFTQAATPAASASTSFQNASQGVSTATDASTLSFRGQREIVRAAATDLAVFGGALGQIVGTAGLVAIENEHLIEGFGGFKNTIAAIATPTNLFVAGLAAIVAGSAYAYESILKTSQAYSQLSDKTNTTVAALRGLDTSAAGKGISDTDFNSAIDKFNQSVQEANIGTGTLAGLLRANGDATGTMVQDLAQVADLIKNAKDSAQQYQILQEAGLPQTQAWVRYLSQGGDAIRAAASSGSGAMVSAEQAMVDKANDLDLKFDSIWKSIKNEGTSAVVYLASKFDDLVNAMSKASDKFYDATLSPLAPPPSEADSLSHMSPAASGKGFSGGGPKSNTEAETRKSIEDQQTYFGLLGQTASISDIVKQKQNELGLSYLNTGITLSGSARAAVLAYTQAQALGTLQIQAQTDSFKTQAGAIGLGVGASEAFTAEQNLLNEAVRNHKDLQPENISAIHSYTDALGKAAQAAALLKLQNDTSFATSQLGRTDIDQNVASQLKNIYGDDYQSHMNDAIAGQIRFNDAMKETKDIAGSALSTFLQDIAAGKTGTVALTDAVTQLENKLFDIISNQAMSALLKAGQGVLGGIIGGGAAPAAPNVGVTSDPLNILPANHTGYGPGDAQTMFRAFNGSMSNWPRHHGGIGPGEHGAVIRDDESVLTPGQMGQLAPVSRQNQGGGTVVNITNNSGAQIQQSKRSSNGVDIVDVMVGAVSRSMATGGMDSALAARPGGKQPIARR